MRRSLSYCEPAQAVAGEENVWKFVFSPSVNLPKGTRLKFDLQSKGRWIDWQVPSINLKKSGPVIYATMGKGKIIPAKEIHSPELFVPQYEFVLPATLEPGKNLTIVLGPNEGDKKKTSLLRAQTIAQRRRSFLLYVDPTGKGRYDDPEVFSMDVRGGALSNIRILVPSFVMKNKRFDIIVRFEDEFGNLTNDAPEDTLIELSHEYLRENLKWKLFVPETGFIALPNLYFNEEGVYTIQLANMKNKQIFRSAPIKCFSEAAKSLFWGILHGESERFDSTENIENCLRHIRDDKALNFIGTSPFESQEETPNEVWKSISQNVAEFDEEERFVGFLGFQWQGDGKSEGLRHFLYAKDNKPILRKKDPKYNTLKKIYKSSNPKEMLSIPCFTMGKGLDYNFENFEPDFERVVEIYNAWGSSENTKKGGNSFPITSTSKNGIQESAEGAIQKALQNNCRFGFVAGGLDDRGSYSDLFESDQEQYTPGMTAIIAQAYTRDAFFDALYNRSCYATTGERILVGLSIASVPMGKEVSTAEKPGLAINRHLAGYVAGTTKLKSVEIIQNGNVLKKFTPEGYSLVFTYDDMVPLAKACLPSKDKKPPFVYYYLRVTQEDGHMAWSSPIWVDYIPLDTLPKALPKKAATKPVPVMLEDLEDEEDIEDDEDDLDDELTEE